MKLRKGNVEKRKKVFLKRAIDRRKIFIVIFFLFFFFSFTRGVGEH